MENILNIGKGYRSYIGTAILFCIGGGLYLGLIDSRIAEALALIVGAITGAAIRAALPK